MNLYINGNCVTINFVEATKQDIADFCIYNITEAINKIDVNSYDLKVDISADLYTYGGQCPWEYDVKDTEVCYDINNGVTQVLSYIGDAYDEVSDKIEALHCTSYMVAELDDVPCNDGMKGLLKVLDELYKVLDDELYKFIKSDWYEGRGL